MLPKYRKPTLPGEILWEEFLKPLDISQSDFVKHLDGSWTQPKLSAIIRGKRAITEAIALDLADALGTTPEFWLNLQTDINLWESQQVHKKIRLHPALQRRGRRLSNQEQMAH
jgi:antitoxin HigA-1